MYVFMYVGMYECMSVCMYVYVYRHACAKVYHLPQVLQQGPGLGFRPEIAIAQRRRRGHALVHRLACRE